MKKFLLLMVIIIVVFSSLLVLRRTVVHKFVVANWPNRADELIAWVDKKSLSGDLYKPKDEFGSYLFVGNYDVDVDFDWHRYGFNDGVAARVVLDENHKPKSVVFVDGSLCGIVIALHAKSGVEAAFGKMPLDLHVSSPRVATFCVERD